MPIENNFQHDEMSRKNPGERITIREVTPTVLSESSSGLDSMAALGKRFSHTGVRVIVLHARLHHGNRRLWGATVG